ncbi:hypothetical protein J8968_14470 [Klebsiella pneumoniae]
MSQVLLTGATGLVGGHLLRLLQNEPRISTIAALTGKRLGAQHMLVVSAMGANAHSPFFYNRVKGEMEAALIEQDWPRLTIARPSMLSGEREKKRTNETFLAPLFRLLPGNWKSIAARDVAIALLAEALSPTHEGVRILTSSELRERAARQAE